MTGDNDDGGGDHDHIDDKGEDCHQLDMIQSLFTNLDHVTSVIVQSGCDGDDPDERSSKDDDKSDSLQINNDTDDESQFNNVETPSVLTIDLERFASDSLLEEAMAIHCRYRSDLVVSERNCI